MSKTSKVSGFVDSYGRRAPPFLFDAKGFLEVLIKMVPKLLLVPALLALTLATALAQDSGAAAKLLPERVGDFRSAGAPRQLIGHWIPADLEDFGVVSRSSRDYLSADGRTLTVIAATAATDSGAYSLLTYVAENYGSPRPALKLDYLGTAGLSSQGRATFFKGKTVIDVRETGAQGDGSAAPALARLLAEGVEAGEGVPILVLHLPEWEKTYEFARFAVSQPSLRAAAPERPVLDAISFEGGAEAVSAWYGESQLVVVESTTPQHSVEMDAAINSRINELRAAGRPVPSVYKRVGNYSVFVFDAKDAAAAERLAGGVKYEKDVRWLGRNPHGDEIAQRAYTRTMTGVVVTVFKTSGLAIGLCLGIGVLFGGIVFMRRRARVSAVKAYSDGGEMLRLNLLDDVSAAQPATNLIGPGKK